MALDWASSTVLTWELWWRAGRTPGRGDPCVVLSPSLLAHHCSA